MTRSTAMLDLGSSSISLLGVRKDSSGDGHFKWDSVKIFIYFGCVFSSCMYNFDIFSKVCANVGILDFVLLESTLGIAYLCMDAFIKQYTKRYDCNKFLNPLLRGISYGRFMQTAVFALLNIGYLVDCLRFLVVSFREEPPWSLCQGQNTSCISAKDVMFFCSLNITTPFAKTSAFYNYLASFTDIDRNTMTTRLFVMGLAWMMVFFCASVTEETILKIFKLTFVCRSLSTVITISFLLVSTNNYATIAFSQLLDIASPSSILQAYRHVGYSFGIGFMGIYDFGAMSAGTMIDTATVIFMAVFTILAFMRSLIVKILYIVMTNCVLIEGRFSPHLLLFAMMPFSTEFLYAHKLYVFYLFGNMLFGTLIYVTNLMLIMAKFLSYEFRSVKQIYIVGLLSCLGFALSTPIITFMTNMSEVSSLSMGVDIAASYLGGLYAAIVMWLYGLSKFSTDIQFWLNFRPTRFWTITWSVLPVGLFCFTIASLVNLIELENSSRKWTIVGWVAFTLAIVIIMNVKTLAGFLVQNNLAGVFKSNKNYGPPEAEDRKRRLYYSEYTRQRKCRHNCLVIDEWFDCNHQTITLDLSEGSSSTSETSLLNLYDAKTSSRIRSIGALAPAAQISS